MESLALVVSIIFFGLIFIGLVGPLLAVLYRKNKIGKYWVFGFLALLVILTVLAWQGSDRLAAITLISGLATAGISFWPKRKP